MQKRPRADWHWVLVVALFLTPSVRGQTASDEPLGVRAQGKDCLTSGCHSGLTDAKIVHQPVAAKACDVCHTATDPIKHLFEAADESAASCYECHDDIEEQLLDKELARHQPATDGECLSCHSVHASDEPALLTQAIGDLCLDCHDDYEDALDESEVVHQPAKERTCNACHAPHASDEPALLTQPVGDLCLDCHGDYEDALDEYEVVHQPAQERTCDACHAPHASDHKDLLIERYPRGLYGVYDEDRFALCFSCHDEELVSEETTDEATSFRNGEQNLHFLHVAKTPKGRSCRICHTPHGGDQQRLIRSSYPFGTEGWQLKIPFRASDTGGSCGPACHAPKGYDRDQPIDWTKPLTWPTKEP